MSANVFKIRAAQRKLAEEGVKLGAIVEVSWDVDPAYGGGTLSHTGIVTRFDDWLHVDQSDRSPGHLYLPITMVRKIRVLPDDALERRPAAPPRKANPFMERAKQRAKPS